MRLLSGCRNQRPLSVQILVTISAGITWSNTVKHEARSSLKISRRHLIHTAIFHFISVNIQEVLYPFILSIYCMYLFFFFFFLCVKAEILLKIPRRISNEFNF